MCGIAGLIRADRHGVSATLARMSEAIQHRGPDDLGYFLAAPGASHLGRQAPDDAGWRLGLAHRRLSILDLSEAGWQPMASADGRYVTVFNGEIYNYQELRAELAAAGHAFHTSSDTEVLLVAYRAWGEAALSRFVGMFAFALLDREANTLFLARDFFGIKPLFYSTFAGGLAFASEVKALLEVPEVGRQVAPGPLYDYLRFGLTDHGESTLLADVRQLLPGHCVTIRLDHPDQVAPAPYWRLDPTPRTDLSFDEATTRVRELFLDAVRLHLRSDVPVGAALSGGIDSSAIVMAMRALEPGVKLHTFSFITDDPAASEEHYMRLVAGAAGATMHEVTPRAEELVADLDDLIAAQDFPFGSTGIYAQFRVFRLARAAGITVMLDGQGADELLAGYRFHLSARLASLLRRGHWLEGARFTARAGGLLSSQGPRLFFQAGGLLLPPGLQAAARRLVGEELAPPWLEAGWFTRQGVALAQPHQARAREILREQLVQAVETTSLPALLRYEDRNSMHFGMESRVPFLTPALARFLLSLPEDYLVGPDGTSKAVFRAAMRGLVPD
ncbi:MAG: hypothetical protein JWM80_3874, partial [Cyanobacteria bacterium RYN_339]|nr:hypothetical protein [Cyanobacteria bacterium RYN_339]